MADQITIDFTHRFASGVELRASLDRALSPGAILVLFGPSGGGKTTILRAIAGLLRPDDGLIVCGTTTWFDARDNRFVPPQARRVGYVSQDTALFPHLTVRANVEYGLHAASPDERRRKADLLVELARLRDLEARYPRQLSGGQAQRVALARALAAEPRLLLLDDPFVALDATTRRALRADVRGLLRETGTSAILVTHDRLEAMAIGDDLAVMVDGRIRQIGPVADVFKRPCDPIVARSVGVETVVPAIVEGVGKGLVTLRIGKGSLTALADATLTPGEEVLACIPAEDVVVEQRLSAGGSARNHLAGVIVAIETEGAVDRVTIDCGFQLVAAITHQSREELALVPGSAVAAAIKATAVHLVAKA